MALTCSIVKQANQFYLFDREGVDERGEGEYPNTNTHTHAKEEGKFKRISFTCLMLFYIEIYVLVHTCIIYKAYSFS